LAKQPSTHLEQWLILIAEKLRSSHLKATLLYEDRYQGNELSLSITTPEGFACLFVHRSASRKASLIFVSESLAAVTLLFGVLRDLHKGVSRFENAKRKFIHRVERVLGLLQESFGIRANEFPVAPLEKLRGLFPEAITMTGAEARFREREHQGGAVELESDEIDEKEEKRFPTRYAVKLQLREQSYASLYHGDDKRFIGKGAVGLEALQRLEERGAKAEAYALSLGVMSVVDPLLEENMRGQRRESSYVDCMIVPDCGNVGGCDLPDCDLPDCSLPDLDCGGCDIGCDLF
jgi:hypothetical protein